MDDGAALDHGYKMARKKISSVIVKDIQRENCTCRYCGKRAWHILFQKNETIIIFTLRVLCLFFLLTFLVWRYYHEKKSIDSSFG